VFVIVNIGGMREGKQLVGGPDRCFAGAAFAEDVKGSVSVMRTETATFVLSVRAFVSKEHVVSEGDSDELSIVRYPSGDTRVIVEKVGSVSGVEARRRAFFIDVVAVDSIVVMGVENRGVDLGSGGTWLKFE
jgi:hypothetical protein